MWPDPVSNPRPLAHESDALPTALCGPADMSVSNPLVTCTLNTCVNMVNSLLKGCGFRRILLM